TRDHDHPKLARLRIPNNARIAEPQSVEIFFLIRRFPRNGLLVPLRIGTQDWIVRMLLPLDPVSRSRQPDRLLLSRATLVEAGLVHVPHPAVKIDVHVIDRMRIKASRRAAFDGWLKFLPLKHVF